MTDYERFTALCKAHGITQRQVGLKLGIHPSTFTHWKKGDYKPRYETRQQLADFFGVNVEWLDEGKTEDQIVKERMKMREEDQILANLAKQADPEQVRLAITFLKTIMGESE